MAGRLRLRRSSRLETMRAHFMSSLRLPAIKFLDSAGGPLPDFTGISGSGIQYGPTGVVPERSVNALLLAGLMVMRLRRPRALPGHALAGPLGQARLAPSQA